MRPHVLLLVNEGRVLGVGRRFSQADGGFERFRGAIVDFGPLAETLPLPGQPAYPRCGRFQGCEHGTRHLQDAIMEAADTMPADLGLGGMERAGQAWWDLRDESPGQPAEQLAVGCTPAAGSHRGDGRSIRRTPVDDFRWTTCRRVRQIRNHRLRSADRTWRCFQSGINRCEASPA